MATGDEQNDAVGRELQKDKVPNCGIGEIEAGTSQDNVVAELESKNLGQAQNGAIVVQQQQNEQPQRQDEEEQQQKQEQQQHPQEQQQQQPEQQQQQEDDASSRIEASEKTELEKEMELFEAAEAEEKSRILSSKAYVSSLGEKENSQTSSQNEKKRALDPTSAPQESRKKRSRKSSRAAARRVEEDDVCFVCFDGGDLMLCDQRTCPKAYHLQCIGRDEKFFQKKGNWICGWHFCCDCSKKGTFRCYTCPKAYCAACKKKTTFFLCKKGKGLCEDCLRLVKLIEGNEGQTEVDFTDRETYEYLFKEYWEDLKAKTNVGVPQFDKDGKAIPGSVADSDDGSDNDAESSESEAPDLAAVADVDDDDDGKRERKTRGLSSLIDDVKCAINQEQKVEHDIKEARFEMEEEEEEEVEEEDEPDEEERDFYKPTAFDGWASKELINFVKSMNEDATKPLTRPTINKLLWQHIKANSLQSTRKKSMIRCDEQLRRLFGKKTVHQQSLLKLIQVHFAPKGAAPGKRGLAVDAKESDADLEDDKGKSKSKSKKQYAAINPANVNLVYLRRALLEDLLEDPQFHQKVVGTYVRIRVPGMVSKNEMCYRLVQVVGTRTQDDEYKAGKKTTKLVLQIMNLGKKEDVTVDLVSNQDFTHEECKRLRQSIRCGIIPAPTVADFEQKNLAIREAKLNDWLETEKARLTALRDRASENGRKRDLRECVEKLQKLQEPSFRSKELGKVPAFEVDPHMDPEYESDDDPQPPAPQVVLDKGRGNTWGSSSFDEKKPPAFTKQDSFKKDEMDWRDNLKNTQVDQSRDQRKDMMPQFPPPPPPGRPPMLFQAPPAPPSLDVHEKVWCYLDPSGMEQGPFTLDQLRTWNKTGLFPPTLRIWRERQPRESGVLLLEILTALVASPPTPPLPPGPPPASQHSGYGLASPAGPAADASRGWDRNDWGQRPNGNVARSPSVLQQPEQLRGYDSWQQQQPQQQQQPSPKFSDGGGYPDSGWRSVQQQQQQQQQQPQQQGWSGWNDNRGMKQGWPSGGRDGGYNEGRKKGTLCRFYQKGYCRNGDACPFQHA